MSLDGLRTEKPSAAGNFFRVLAKGELVRPESNVGCGVGKHLRRAQHVAPLRKRFRVEARIRDDGDRVKNVRVRPRR